MLCFYLCLLNIIRKGLHELLEEGAVQILRDREREDEWRGRGSDVPMLAAVGKLQLDVVEYRLKHVRTEVYYFMSTYLFH